MQLLVFSSLSIKGNITKMEVKSVGACKACTGGAIQN